MLSTAQFDARWLVRLDVGQTAELDARGCELACALPSVLLILREVAREPHSLGVILEGQDVGGHAVQEPPEV